MEPREENAEPIIPLLGREEDAALKQLQAQYGAPAYVRRARGVQDAHEALLARCRRQREEWLSMVRICLGRLQALAGDWSALRSWLADDAQVELLRSLHAALQPRLRSPVLATTSARVLRQNLMELHASIERFNRRWDVFLQGIDVSKVNELREGYNRYYLLEKECAVHSSRLARQGFCPLPPLTAAELAAALPPLPLPRLR